MTPDAMVVVSDCGKAALEHGTIKKVELFKNCVMIFDFCAIMTRKSDSSLLQCQSFIYRAIFLLLFLKYC